MPIQTVIRFAPGQICYSAETQVALRQAGIQGFSLICRHLTGDWGDVDDKRRLVNRWAVTHPQDERNLPIISRFLLPGELQIAIITRRLHTPAKRQTTLSLWPPAVKVTVKNGRKAKSNQLQSLKRNRPPQPGRRQETKICGPTQS